MVFLWCKVEPMHSMQLNTSLRRHARKLQVLGQGWSLVEHGTGTSLGWSESISIPCQTVLVVVSRVVMPHYTDEDHAPGHSAVQQTRDSQACDFETRKWKHRNVLLPSCQLQGKGSPLPFPASATGTRVAFVWWLPTGQGFAHCLSTLTPNPNCSFFHG